MNCLKGFKTVLTADKMEGGRSSTTNLISYKFVLVFNLFVVLVTYSVDYLWPCLFLNILNDLFQF